jgi:hypothetical protein
MITLTISANGVGHSELPLNQLLLSNYLKVLIKLNQIPTYVCLYSEGVHIACKNSVFLDSLLELQSKGSKIILCKTCVDYFNIADQIAIGEIGTMLQIVEAQLSASINLKP